MSAISEIGSTLIGLGGLTLAWRSTTRTFAHERTLADLAAVRDVLEEGAIYLHRASYALDLVKLDLQGNAPRVHARLNEIFVTCDEILERLKVRLKRQHRATVEFSAAVEATRKAAQVVQRVVDLHLPNLEKGGDSAIKQVTAQLDDAGAELMQWRSDFDAHREAFIDAAAATVGADLPPPI
jgi:hypothetical protein